MGKSENSANFTLPICECDASLSYGRENRGNNDKFSNFVLVSAI